MTQFSKEPSVGQMELALRLTADKLPIADLCLVIQDLKEAIKTGVKFKPLVGLPIAHELRLLKEQLTARLDRIVRWDEQAKIAPQPDLKKAKGCSYCLGLGWRMIGDHQMFPPTHCSVCQ
jgi:hypothetical protein